MPDVVEYGIVYRFTPQGVETTVQAARVINSEMAKLGQAGVQSLRQMQAGLQQSLTGFRSAGAEAGRFASDLQKAFGRAGLSPEQLRQMAVRAKHIITPETPASVRNTLTRISAAMQTESGRWQTSLQKSAERGRQALLQLSMQAAEMYRALGQRAIPLQVAGVSPKVSKDIDSAVASMQKLSRTGVDSGTQLSRLGTRFTSFAQQASGPTKVSLEKLGDTLDSLSQIMQTAKRVEPVIPGTLKATAETARGELVKLSAEAEKLQRVLSMPPGKPIGIAGLGKTAAQELQTTIASVQKLGQTGVDSGSRLLELGANLNNLARQASGPTRAALEQMATSITQAGNNMLQYENRARETARTHLSQLTPSLQTLQKEFVALPAGIQPILTQLQAMAQGQTFSAQKAMDLAAQMRNYAQSLQAAGVVGKPVSDQLMQMAQALEANATKTQEATVTAREWQRAQASNIRYQENMTRRMKEGGLQWSAGINRTYEQGRALNWLSGAAAGAMLGINTMSGSLVGLTFGLIFMKFNMVTVAVATAALTMAFMSLTRTITKAISAFKAFQDAVMPLIWAIKAVGGSLLEMGNAMEFARRESLKLGKPIDDTAAAVRKLTMEGLMSGEAWLAVTNIMGATGSTLTEAANTFTTAVGRQTGSLETLADVLGVDVINAAEAYNETTDRQARLTQAAALVNERLAGAAEAHARTLTGATDRVKTAFQALFSALGAPLVRDVILPALNGLANYIAKLSELVRAFFASEEGARAWSKIMAELRGIVHDLGWDTEGFGQTLRTRFVSALLFGLRVLYVVIWAFRYFINILKQVGAAVKWLAGVLKPLFNLLGRLAGFLKNLNFKAILQSVKEFSFDAPSLLRAGLYGMIRAIGETNVAAAAERMIARLAERFGPAIERLIPRPLREALARIFGRILPRVPERIAELDIARFAERFVARLEGGLTTEAGRITRWRLLRARILRGTEPFEADVRAVGESIAARLRMGMVSGAERAEMKEVLKALFEKSKWRMDVRAATELGEVWIRDLIRATTGVVEKAEYEGLVRTLGGGFNKVAAAQSEGIVSRLARSLFGVEGSTLTKSLDDIIRLSISLLNPINWFKGFESLVKGAAAGIRAGIKPALQFLAVDIIGNVLIEVLAPEVWQAPLRRMFDATLWGAVIGSVLGPAGMVVGAGLGALWGIINEASEGELNKGFGRLTTEIIPQGFRDVAAAIVASMKATIAAVDLPSWQDWLRQLLDPTILVRNIGKLVAGKGEWVIPAIEWDSKEWWEVFDREFEKGRRIVDRDFGEFTDWLGERFKTDTSWASKDIPESLKAAMKLANDRLQPTIDPAVNALGIHVATKMLDRAKLGLSAVTPEMVTAITTMMDASFRNAKGQFPELSVKEWAYLTRATVLNQLKEQMGEEAWNEFGGTITRMVDNSMKLFNPEGIRESSTAAAQSIRNIINEEMKTGVAADAPQLVEYWKVFLDQLGINIPVDASNKVVLELSKRLSEAMDSPESKAMRNALAKSYMEGLLKGMDLYLASPEAYRYATGMDNEIQRMLRRAGEGRSPMKSMYPIGEDYARGITESMVRAFRRLDLLSDPAAALLDQAGAFAGVGRTYADALVDAFRIAIQGMSDISVPTVSVPAVSTPGGGGGGGGAGGAGAREPAPGVGRHPADWGSGYLTDLGLQRLIKRAIAAARAHVPGHPVRYYWSHKEAVYAMMAILNELGKAAVYEGQGMIKALQRGGIVTGRAPVAALLHPPEAIIPLGGRAGGLAGGLAPTIVVNISESVVTDRASADRLANIVGEAVMKKLSGRYSTLDFRR